MILNSARAERIASSVKGVGTDVSIKVNYMVLVPNFRRRRANGVYQIRASRDLSDFAPVVAKCKLESANPVRRANLLEFSETPRESVEIIVYSREGLGGILTYGQATIRNTPQQIRPFWREAQ